ncbi:MAG TPA: GNAT family N-acetyltransferase [Gemmatimonadaceae bacterium]|jgi:predicted N-acetyltransferase YhbS|nr:GNAT family N-acetyltransferase [Gemmatimonadaceae bacterium]
MFTIRDARPDDRAAVRELTLRAYAEFEAIMDPVSWTELDGAIRGALASNAPADCIVADAGGTIVGSVMLYPAKADAYGDRARAVDCPEVRLVAVAPEARGRGVARALMEECIRRARAWGSAALGLHTSRSMRGAMALYSGMGFRRTPDTDFQPPGAELVEGYRLTL